MNNFAMIWLEIFVTGTWVKWIDLGAGLFLLWLFIGLFTKKYREKYHWGWRVLLGCFACLSLSGFVFSLIVGL